MWRTTLYLLLASLDNICSKVRQLFEIRILGPHSLCDHLCELHSTQSWGQPAIRTQNIYTCLKNKEQYSLYACSLFKSNIYLIPLIVPLHKIPEVLHTYKWLSCSLRQTSKRGIKVKTYYSTSILNSTSFTLTQILLFTYTQYRECLTYLYETERAAQYHISISL